MTLAHCLGAALRIGRCVDKNPVLPAHNKRFNAPFRLNARLRKTGKKVSSYLAKLP
jgi:hypothetical protein